MIKPVYKNPVPHEKVFGHYQRGFKLQSIGNI